MLKHLILAVSLASPLPLMAQDEMNHDGHMMGDKGPASMAFMEANSKMHEMMAIEYTGNADVDFIKGMIPHHQGAIDMARVQLRHGKDPAMRKLATDIIKAQEKEIAFLRQWLDKHGKTRPTGAGK